MSARVVDLLVNTARPPGAVLLARRSELLPAEAPVLVDGEKVLLRVQWVAPAATLEGAPAVVALEAGDVILFSLKTRASDATLLASGTGFLASGVGAELRYEALVNLDTAPMAAAVAEEPVIAAIGEIRVQNAANTARKSYQFPVTLRRRVYAGEGDPVAANPQYPAADAVALRVPANGTYRIKTAVDGQYFQLKHAATGLFHSVFLTGAAGAETLAFGAGEN